MEPRLLAASCEPAAAEQACLAGSGWPHSLLGRHTQPRIYLKIIFPTKIKLTFNPDIQQGWCFLFISKYILQYYLKLLLVIALVRPWPRRGSAGQLGGGQRLMAGNIACGCAHRHSYFYTQPTQTFSPISALTVHSASPRTANFEAVCFPQSVKERQGGQSWYPGLQFPPPPSTHSTSSQPPPLGREDRLL